MSRCPNCGQLAGQSGEVDPPAEMRVVSQYFASNGVVEIYRCRPCGSQWERRVATELGERSGAWKHLRAA
jgi:hypothetical protein